jgi:hypothetical protein
MEPETWNLFMKQTILLIVVFCLLNIPVFSQTKEARKVVEFGSLPCGYFNPLMMTAYEDYKKSTDSKLYVVFYEAKNEEVFTTNKKTNAEEKKIIKPRRGNALNRAKEIPLFLETAYQVPAEKVVLIDGGFRENLEIEIWIVPKNAEPPKPSPTVNPKDVKFDKGKPFEIRRCANIYDPLNW